MHNLAIVTSCTGYGQYLSEWAASIAALQQRPGMVGIVTHGTEGDGNAGRAAGALLEGIGLRVKREHYPDRLDLGEARNRAVALSDTEWVMHLDCDDTIMPHALGDIAALAPKCDIVALGYERTGDLASGPANRSKTYRSSRNGAELLANPTPCSGVSPFRRALWERSPYRTDLTGGWDTCLWIGFGHLNARILPTKRPAFWYRQHRDSTFNTRRKSPWKSTLAGRIFTGHRRGDHGVSVLVPRDTEGEPMRAKHWAWLRRFVETHHPDWEIVEGTAPGRSWCKGAALEVAMHQARGRVLVVLDADCLLPPDSLREAVRLVEGGTPWVVPHTQVLRLRQDATRRLVGTDPAVVPHFAGPPPELHRGPYQGFAGGGCFVVLRAVYEACGGIPKVFRGWGAEDEAMAVILDTLAGPHVRLPGPLWHLWHTPQARRPDTGAQNRTLFLALAAMKGQPDQMFARLTGGTLRHGTAYYDASQRYRTLERAHAIRRQVEARTMDKFAERRLERAHDLAKAREAARLERISLVAAVQQGQRARTAARIAARMARKMGPAAVVENKMGPPAPVANKLVAVHTEPSVTDPQDTGWMSGLTYPTESPDTVAADDVPDGTLSVKFARPEARALAEESGLTDADFADVEPGPRGYTMAHVRALTP